MPDNQFAGMDDAVSGVMQQTLSNTAGQIRNNIQSVSGQNPDQAAEYQHLAKFVNVPFETVQQHPELIKQQAAAQRLDADGLAQGAPQVANYLTDPHNAAKSHDDLPSLVGLEGAVKAMPAPKHAAPSFGESSMAFIGDNLKSLVSAPGADSAPAEFVKGLGGAFNKAAGSVNLALGAVPTIYDKIASTISGKPNTDMSDAWFKRFVDPLMAAQSTFEAGTGASFTGKAFNTAGNLLGMLSQISLTSGAGDVAPAAQSAPALLGQVASHGTKSMAFPALSDSISTANRVYQETGDAEQAIRAAQMQYATTTMGGMVPLSAPGALGVRLAGGFVSGLATGELSRTGMNMVLPTSMQQPFDLEGAALSGLAGAGLGGVMGPHAQPAYHDALRQTYAEAAKAEQSEKGMQSLQALGEMASASKTRERDPEAFKQLVRNMTEDGKLQDVYISADKLGEVLNQSGVTVEQLAKTMPDVAAQIHEATMTNGDVRIPVEDYATHIAGGPVDAALMPHLKVDPDGMTYHQGQEYFAHQKEAMQVQAEKLVAEKQADDAKQAEGQAIHDNILAQLNAVKRFNPRVNESYAALMREYFNTQAERAGMTPQALFEMSGLNIKGESLMGDSLDQRLFPDPAMGRWARDTTQQWEPSFEKVKRMAREGKVTDADATAINAISKGDESQAVGKLDKLIKEIKKRPASELNQSPAEKDIGDLRQQWADAGIKSAISESADRITLSKIIVPESDRGNGKGSAAMQALIDYADAVGKHVVLSPSGDFGGNKKRLSEFYKRFGFVDNKGKDRAFTTMESMYRTAPGKVLEQGNRGAFNPESATLSLLKNADLSTFLHESGHFFLENAMDLAMRPEASDNMRADTGTLLDYFGIKDTPAMTALDQWHAMTLEEKRDSHEQFAQGFEKYLMEGKAPTIELQGLFSRFRSWLVNVYKSLKNLNVELTPEVRGVMDRMLASDAAIKEAEQTRKYKLLFDTPEAAGISREAFSEYEKQGQDATDQAVADMDSRSIKDMQWLSNAKNKAIKALQKEASAERSKIRDEVAKEVDQNLAFQAADFIRENTGDVEHKEAVKSWKLERDAQNEALKAEPKEDRAHLMQEWESQNPKPERAPTNTELWEKAQDTKRAELVDQVKADIWESSPEFAAGEKGIKKGQFFAKNKRAIDNEVERRLIAWVDDNPRPAKAGPLPKEFVAEMFGFEDEHAMNDAIKQAGNKKEVIDGLTDQRMLERHGELTEARSIERAAEAAIHNDARAKFMATGLKILSKSPMPARQLAKAAKEAADTAIAAKRVRDLRPAQYSAAEASANSQAIKLASKDPQGAVQAQRAALLNNRLFKAATDAVTEIHKGVEYLNKFDKPSVRENIDLEYRDQIDALLNRHDIRKSVSGAELDKRVSLLDFVERTAAQGYEPQISEKILNEAKRLSYKDLSVEEFRGLIEAVKSIDHLGRLKSRLMDGAEMREIRELADEAAATMGELPQRSDESNRGLTFMESKWLGAKSAGRSMQAALLKMEQMMDWLDNRNTNGVMNRVVFRRIADAGVKENDLQVKIKAGIDDLLHSNLADVTKEGRKIYQAKGLIDGLTGKTQKFTKKEMLALAGNMGNDSNLNKLIAGEKWDESAVWSFLHENMSKADWDFVAGLGKTLETLWPEKLAMSRRLGSTNPEKIAPRAFDTPHGRYDGWYWPMIYDPARAQDVAERGAKAGDTLFENIYTKANTDTGRMNTRNENYARPLLLSLDVIPRVIKDEIHDIAYREAIIDADKFLSFKTVRESISSALSPEHYDQLRPWLQSIANDRKVDMQALKWFDQLAHGARTRATIVGLGYRVSTMLVHGSSAALESVAEVGPVWFAKGLADFANPIQWTANRDFIFERSGEMRNRMNEVDRDVREHLREIDLRLMDTTSSAVSRGADLMKAHAYQGIAMLDMASALPTWMAAYHKGMAAESAGGKGLNEADAVYFADKTVRNAHGGTGVKDQAAVQRGPEFFKLFTMFYTFWNHNVNRLMDTARMAKDPNTWRDSEKAGQVIMRTLIYTLGIQAMHGMLHPKKDGEGEEGWLAWAGEEFTASAFAGIPILRDLSAHYLTGKDYSVTPAASMVDAIGKSGIDVANALTGKETNPKVLKHTIVTAGYAFGLPLGQPASSMQFLWDVTDGKQHPEAVMDWARGLMHGDMKKH